MNTKYIAATELLRFVRGFLGRVDLVASSKMDLVHRLLYTPSLRDFHYYEYCEGDD